jgi:hypothetical protein
MTIIPSPYIYPNSLWQGPFPGRKLFPLQRQRQHQPPKYNHCAACQKKKKKKTFCSLFSNTIIIRFIAPGAYIGVRYNYSSLAGGHSYISTKVRPIRSIILKIVHTGVHLWLPLAHIGCTEESWWSTSYLSVEYRTSCLWATEWANVINTEGRRNSGSQSVCTLGKGLCSGWVTTSRHGSFENIFSLFDSPWVWVWFPCR